MNKGMIAFYTTSVVMGSVFAYGLSQPADSPIFGYQNPDYVGYTADGSNLGYIDSKWLDITGTDFKVTFKQNSTGSPPAGYYFMNSDQLKILSPTGQALPLGSVIGYSWTQQDYANGYLMVAWDDLANGGGYVQVLNGNYDWVTNQLNDQQTTAFNKDNVFNSQSLQLVNFADVVDDSGAIFTTPNGTLTTGPTEDVNTITVQTSPVPHAEVSVGKPSAPVGQPIPITLTAQIASYHETHHREAVEITGPNGYDKWVDLTKFYASSEYGVTGSSSNSDDMAVVGDGDRGGYDGAPPKLVSYPHTMNLPTTGLAPGMYTVHYYVDDWFGRSADNTGVTATFAVGSTMTLSANPLQNPIGDPSTLTAAVPTPPAGSTVEIDGTVLAPDQAVMDIQSPSTTFSAWSGTGNETQTWVQKYDEAAQIQYVAKLIENGQVVDQSNTVTVQWGTPPSVTLTASPATLPVGDKTTLQAVANNIPGTDKLWIIDQTHPSEQLSGYEAMGFTNSYTLQDQDSQDNPETDTYMAEIVDYEGNIIARSQPEKVTWTSSGPGGGGSNPFKEQMNLVLTAHEIPQSVPMGQSYNQKFEVSNDGDSAVSTVLQFSYSGMTATYVAPSAPGECPYWINTPVTYTKDYPVSLAPKGVEDLSIPVQAGEDYVAYSNDGSCADWEQNEDYTFSWTAYVNPDHNPSEITYDDNYLTMTIPTFGQIEKEPTPYVISNPPGYSMFGEKDIYNPNWTYYNGQWHYIGPGPAKWVTGQEPFQPK
jgi:hypothetical protein